MKVISILGSPNGEKGNTGMLLEEVLKGAKSLGAVCETVSLRGDSLKPCLGCNQCHKKGICHQKDDFESIKGKVLAADGLILATPNYISHVSAQLKVFLDRCAGLIHCMSLEGKYGMSVVTSGGGDEWPIVQYLNHFLMITGVIPVDAVWAEMGTTKDRNLDEKICDQAFNAGRNLVDAWKSKRRLATAEKIQDAHRERMRELVRYYRAEWPYEYKYWQERAQSEPFDKTGV
ncbi:MAG: flavodoxin family protein [Syntrophobacteraceae bacterium]|nr:flavodoxin family protein [Syntrophobacteraceae bacterium]